MDYAPLIDKTVKTANENDNLIQNEDDKKEYDNVLTGEEVLLDVDNPNYEYNSLKKGETDTYEKKKREKRCYIIMAISYIIWAFFYKVSLKGGRIEDFTPDYLFGLAKYHTISFLCYSLNLWMIGFMDISKKKKTILYSVMVFSLLGFLLYDHGELFDYHGLYNFALFFLFILIFDGIALVLYTWCRLAGLKMFIIQFIVINSTVFIVTYARLNHYMSIWGDGFIGKKIEDGKNLCVVERPIPWFDLLPNGALNFWTGSQSCARKEHFEALFENNKLVVRGCSKKDVTYMILPDTRNFTFVQKERWELREVVSKKMESAVYHYTEPVELNDAEAVYVTCGKQNKLVTRVAPGRIKPSEEEQPIEKLNVLLVFIDAISRHYFLHKLPKTAKKLESIHNSGVSHLNQFFRYGVVDINTFGNTLAMYTGTEGIRHLEYEDKKGTPIWEEYRNRGYVAGLVKNGCEDWDTSNNRRTAFSVDHELLAPFCLPEYHERYGNPYKNLKGPYSLRRRCITGQYVHNYALNYTRDFIKTYDGKNPWFFVASFIEAHESTAEVIGLMDDDLERFFDSISEETLKRTAIFVMSDHGLHIGLSYLFSNQGRVEHKLPLLATLFPNQFLEKYPEIRKNLEDNEQKLINGYNIYETLRDLLEFDPKVEPHERVKGGVDISEYIKEKESNDKDNSNKSKSKRNILYEWDEERFHFQKRTEEYYYKSTKEKPKTNKVYDNANQKNATIVWGKSLLRDIPYRTCQEDLIEDKYCVCH